MTNDATSPGVWMMYKAQRLMMSWVFASLSTSDPLNESQYYILLTASMMLFGTLHLIDEERLSLFFVLGVTLSGLLFSVRSCTSNQSKDNSHRTGELFATSIIITKSDIDESLSQTPEENTIKSHASLIKRRQVYTTFDVCMDVVHIWGAFDGEYCPLL